MIQMHYEIQTKYQLYLSCVQVTSYKILILTTTYLLTSQSFI